MTGDQPRIEEPQRWSDGRSLASRFVFRLTATNMAHQPNPHNYGDPFSDRAGGDYHGGQPSPRSQYAGDLPVPQAYPSSSVYSGSAVSLQDPGPQPQSHQHPAYVNDEENQPLTYGHQQSYYPPGGCVRLMCESMWPLLTRVAQIWQPDGPTIGSQHARYPR